MNAFKKALEKIKNKKWAYDFEQMVEGLKEEVKGNPFHQKIQNTKNKIVIRREQEKTDYRRLFFLGLESLVIFWGDLLIGLGIAFLWIAGGLFKILFRIANIKITTPVKDLLKTNPIVKWYAFIGLLIIIGVVAMSWVAFLEVWGQV